MSNQSLYNFSSSPIENEFMYEKYIKPFVWEGFLWLDGGWGDKNFVQDLLSDDPITGFKVPFYVSPTNLIDPSGHDYDRKYIITFTGENWKLLHNFIEAVKTSGVKNQTYILNSYFSTQVPDPGTNLYQLRVTVIGDTTTINIDRGTWIPSFEESLTIAGW